MDKKEFWSVSEISFKTGFTRQWVLDLIKRFQIKPIVNQWEGGVKYDYIVPDEDAQKLFRYAEKRKKVDEKRKALRAA